MILLGEGERRRPAPRSLQLCGALFELLALPAGSPERRAIEERVWALIARGRPNAALRAFSEKVGFTKSDSGSRDRHFLIFAVEGILRPVSARNARPPAPVVVLLTSALVLPAVVGAMRWIAAR